MIQYYVLNRDIHNDEKEKKLDKMNEFSYKHFLIKDEKLYYLDKVVDICYKFSHKKEDHEFIFGFSINKHD